MYSSGTRKPHLGAIASVSAVTYRGDREEGLGNVKREAKKTPTATKARADVGAEKILSSKDTQGRQRGVGYRESERGCRKGGGARKGGRDLSKGIQNRAKERGTRILRREKGGRAALTEADTLKKFSCFQGGSTGESANLQGERTLLKGGRRKARAGRGNCPIITQVPGRDSEGKRGRPLYKEGGVTI